MGDALIGYRCYFLGQDGRIYHADEFTAPNDSAAINIARHLFQKNQYPGVELWHGDKIIYVEGVSAPKPH